MMGLLLTSGLFAALAYGIGSVPFGLLLTQAFHNQDLRGIGSGNIGATNVLRTGSKALALATLILDAGKAIVPVLIIYQLERAGFPTQPWWPGLVALAVCLGHCFPIWLQFQGGKAVSCFLGVWLALFFWGGVSLCAVWLIIAALWRQSSLAALSASFAAPLLVYDRPELLGFMLALSVLVWLRHRANLQRLLAGTEPKIGQSTEGLRTKESKADQATRTDQLEVGQAAEGNQAIAGGQAIEVDQATRVNHTKDINQAVEDNQVKEVDQATKNGPST